MTIRIWMLTWNCENQAPNDAMLNSLIDSAFKQNGNMIPSNSLPHILVIALQEASTHHLQFVSHRLAKSNMLGNEFQHILSSSIMGTTKGPPCFVQLGVLVRRTFQVQRDTSTPLNAKLTNQAQVSDIVDRGAGTYKDGIFRCKGGAFSRIEYMGRRFGFIGAHLVGPGENANAQKTQRNDEEIRMLLRHLVGDTAATTDAQINNRLEARFDAVFFMGDLNYRLSSTAPLPNAIHGANPLILIDMLNAVSQSTTRHSLWDIDTLNGVNVPAGNHSPLVRDFNFRFPTFDNNPLPTYKRYYQDSAANNSCKQIAANTYAPNGYPSQYATAVWQCYFNNQSLAGSAASVKRPGFYELGWLDRIGYRLSGPIPSTAALNLAQGFPKFQTFDDLVLSDHTPVMMKIELQ